MRWGVSIPNIINIIKQSSKPNHVESRNCFIFPNQYCFPISRMHMVKGDDEWTQGWEGAWGDVCLPISWLLVCLIQLDIYTRIVRTIKPANTTRFIWSCMGTITVIRSCIMQWILTALRTWFLFRKKPQAIPHPCLSVRGSTLEEYYVDSWVTILARSRGKT